MPVKSKKTKENFYIRPPVVVVLGHVDHGKSSLLEAIKDFKITSKEAGGITQHVGAYEVGYNGKDITFIDTPGHEAFSAMRSRGAQVADIAILVVAVDEEVKPQTKEAIFHIKKAGIPMIVALNKMDKPEANPEKIKRELAAQEILVESMGGKIPSVELSAKTKKGIPELLDLILLIAEIEELRGDPLAPVEGVVIESYMDPNRGPTATIILRNGSLKRGDSLGTVSACGKIKMMEDFQGRPVEKAMPSKPVILIGCEEVPGVGEIVKKFLDVESAKKEIKPAPPMPQQVLVADSGKRILNLILKVDVRGSLEAIAEIIKEIPQEKVLLKILKAEVGDISESDVKTARNVNAKILGFRVKTSPAAKALATREKITIVIFDIIYELAQSARQLLEKLVAPEISRIELGKIKILEFFKTEKSRQIVGGRVIAGEVSKGASVEIVRGDEKIGKGRIVGLQKNKKDVDEATKGSECGILYDGQGLIEKGDILAAYAEERRKGEL